MEGTVSMRPDKEAPQEVERRERRPPLLAVMIVRNAMNVVSPISVKEWCDRIYSGVLAIDNKLKFWVDRDLGKNCFLLLVESIDGINNCWGRWEWIYEKEICYEGEVPAPVTRLVGLRRLVLSATFRTIMLSPRTTYDVAFVVKGSEDWLASVTDLSLTLPDGTRLGRSEYQWEKPKEEWIDILVGTFVTTPENIGEVTVKSTLPRGGARGLTVKGIVFRPKD